MTEENYLNFQVSKLSKVFKQHFPELVLLAQQTLTPESFKIKLQEYINTACLDEERAGEKRKAVERILLLINYDNTTIDELSIGEKIHVRTITYLWQFLREELEEEISTDFILDLFHQLKYLKNPPLIKSDRNLLKKQMNRWPSGLDESVVAVREKNRDRIIKGLIKKIERRHAPSSRYQFEEGMSYEAKYHQVSEWWNSSRFHLTLAIKSPTELNVFLGNTLSDETMRLFLHARKKGMPF
ncbi:KamA family protein, partial [Parabacteroides sp. OttesenSCG-928-G21]|nr:KamA family protein [Parabacteroides sp. OttesenSCG-928-G21]